MIHSMTGFAAAKGEFGPHSWTWELRSVNSKGLDLRLRVPDWITGLEVALRKRLGACVDRGNVTLSLRLSRIDEGSSVAINMPQLDAILGAMNAIETRAMDAGLSLAPSKAADIVTMRGVLETKTTEDDPAPLLAALLDGFEPLLAAFLDMRRAEGRALDRVFHAQLDQIETLTTNAAEAAIARRDETAANLRKSLARIIDNTDNIDEARVIQEIALIAVKADVTEEIDRLGAHIGAARDLLQTDGPVGRKLDFLTQEFNREANTLCSKAQSKALTAIGLDLKAVIDQMREQVQNVE